MAKYRVYIIDYSYIVNIALSYNVSLHTSLLIIQYLPPCDWKELLPAVTWIFVKNKKNKAINKTEQRYWQELSIPPTLCCIKSEVMIVTDKARHLIGSLD